MKEVKWYCGGCKKGNAVLVDDEVKFKEVIKKIGGDHHKISPACNRIRLRLVYNFEDAGEIDI